MTVTYRPAPAVQRIAEALIAKHHHHLDDIRIEYVFRSEAAKDKGKTVWGKARKISGLNAYLSQPLDPDETPAGEDVDYFVIEIAEDIWAVIDQRERVALVDHELCHCTTDFNKDGDLVLKIRPHDLEEFRQVVQRHGLWRDDVQAFSDAMHFQQGTLDEVAPDEGGATVSVNGGPEVPLEDFTAATEQLAGSVS